MLWCLWKARNEEVFNAKKSTPFAVVARARAMRCEIKDDTATAATAKREPSLVRMDTWIILIDGSWDTTNRSGIGMVCFDQNGRLVQVQGERITAQDPLQAEAKALIKALNYVLAQRQHQRKFVIYSDCRTLIDAVQSGTIEGLPSWRAAVDVGNCIALMEQVSDDTEIGRAHV